MGRSDEAHARDSDTLASHEAAKTVDVRRDRCAVLMLLAYLGEATDQTVEANAWRVEHGTPQSLRSRRAELMRDGLVEVASADGRTASGRRCRVFRLTPQGIKAAALIDAPFYLSEW